MKNLFSISAIAQSNWEEPVLALQVESNSLAFAIGHKKTNTLYSLSYYSFEELQAELFAEIQSLHTALTTPFKEVLISCHLNQPASFFEQQSIRHTKLTLPKDIEKAIKAAFPEAKIMHHTALLINKAEEAGNEGQLRVNIANGHFTLLALQKDKLLTIQNYEYSSPHDMLFYLLSVCKHHSLKPADVELFLSGLIEKDSLLYRELFYYFGIINFKEVSWQINENPYPTHYFSLLNDLLLCE